MPAHKMPGTQQVLELVVLCFVFLLVLNSDYRKLHDLIKVARLFTGLLRLAVGIRPVAEFTSASVWLLTSHFLSISTFLWNTPYALSAILDHGN